MASRSRGLPTARFSQGEKVLIDRGPLPRPARHHRSERQRAAEHGGGGDQLAAVNAVPFFGRLLTLAGRGTFGAISTHATPMECRIRD
jgi:hypothetical protein